MIIYLVESGSRKSKLQAFPLEEPELASLGPGLFLICTPSVPLAQLLLKLAQRNAEFGGLSAKISPIGLGRSFGDFGGVVFHETLLYAQRPGA
jgi:hypothetical protein